MREQFIINARHSLRARHRWVSDLLTAALWAGWILLWLPVFRKLREVVRLHVDFELAAREVLDTVTPISLTHSLLALIGTVALLLLWSRLPKRKAIHAPPTLATADYARHFAISETELEAGRASRVCVVAHDETGAVIGIQVAG